MLETARGEAVRCTVVVSALGLFFSYLKKGKGRVDQERKLFVGKSTAVQSVVQEYATVIKKKRA